MVVPRLEELPAQPKMVVLHWSAGGPEPNSTDLRAYHYLVAQSGEIHPGVPVEQNMRDIVPGTPYAAHTRGMNSYSVGVALCGMTGAVENKTLGPHPITESQMEAACRFVAELCAAWSLPVTHHTVFTHWEAGFLHGVRQSKWDITVLPWRRDISREYVGPLIREWVRSYVMGTRGTPEPQRPTFPPGRVPPVRGID